MCDKLFSIVRDNFLRVNGLSRMSMSSAAAAAVFGPNSALVLPPGPSLGRAAEYALRAARSRQLG